MRNIDNVMLSEKQFKIAGTLNTIMIIQVCIDKKRFLKIIKINFDSVIESLLFFKIPYKFLFVAQ